MLNIPNMLSIFRLCLVPVFVCCYFSGLPDAHLYAIIIYVVATFTDFLDGYLARKWNVITNLGKVLDPLGDKCLTFAVLLCITIDGIIPVWIISLFTLKEILMALGGLYIHNRVKTEIPPANIIGKTATVVFFVVCVVLILFSEQIPPTVAVAMIAFALLISFAALVSYLQSFLRLLGKNKDGIHNSGE